MKPIILGTAGHIDHGKTSLIRTITGIDTDRLKEEKARGITIELGFAFLDLPSGQHVGIVDVPGHEKFVKNMVAGATGIDIVVMVIAADEGVMPQTREHMEICTLLGVRHGFTVLTKIDLVDEEMHELAKEDIGDFARGTFLEDTPLVAFSAVTGQGGDEFVEVLDRLCAKIPERTESTLFRLPVDRVFTMKGFGTVITGTLASGSVRVGDPVILYPSGVRTKVRGIQVHNHGVAEAHAGMRTAINFQGLDRESVNRGDVLAAPGTLEPSFMADLSVRFLKSNPKPIKNRTRVRFHTGTSEVLGNLILLDRDELKPGDDAVAQMRLDRPVALVKDDRYVLRSYSPVRTIGGGQVLNPIPPKHRRFRQAVVDGLRAVDRMDPEALAAYCVEGSGYQGVSFNQLKLMTNLSEKPLEKALGALLSRKELVQIDRENRIFIHRRLFEKIQKQALAVLEAYHKRNPLKAGMSKEELKSKFPVSVGPKVFTLVLNQLGKDGAVAVRGEGVRLAGHQVSLGADQTDLRAKILEAYLDSGLTPPYFRELARTLSVDPAQAKDVLMLLVQEGEIVKTKDDLYFHRKAIEALKARLVDFLRAEGEISTPQFKKMTGASRKYVIPLLEYFDSQNITLRIGDIRKLRKG